MVRPGAIDEVEGLDEEFLYHLGRGSDLLARGDAEAAQASLERARQLRPKDAKVLGLLGQACYRLGQFERAAEVYGKLVDDNPVEAAARVNLGLASLKAKRFEDAVRQLTIALDLNPEHRRAMGYLGLALLESNRVAEAREWFVKAGSEQMVARCDGHLASGEARSVSAAPDLAAPEPIRTPHPGGMAAVAPDAGIAALAAYASSRLLAIPAGQPFAVEGRTLAVAVRGDMLVRTDGLFAVRGTLRLVPEMKRFRGRATEQAFGDGARRMVRASGEGVLLCALGDRRFTPLELGGESGFFHDETVFALEDGIAFENGRVPSRFGADLNLVHLRGQGRFVLVTRGEPVAVEIAPAAPLRVPIAALVGWVGALTPKVVALVDAPEPDRAAPLAVELSGEGRALVDPGRADGLGAD